MGWFKDLTSSVGDEFENMWQAQGIGSDPGRRDPNAISAPMASQRGINSLYDIAYDDQGNLKLPTYIAPSQTTQQGLAALAARAGNDPMAALSEKYYTDILSGGGTNPYLDRAYEQAAGKVRGSLSSQFERAGRYGGSDHEIATGQALGDLATNIYGGQYNADQARMMQAAQLAPSAGFQNIQRQLAAGQILDEQARSEADWEYNSALDRINEYLMGVQGYKAGAPNPELKRNKLAEGLAILSSIGRIAAAPATGGASMVG